MLVACESWVSARCVARYLFSFTRVSGSPLEVLGSSCFRLGSLGLLDALAGRDETKQAMGPGGFPVAPNGQSAGTRVDRRE